MIAAFTGGGGKTTLIYYLAEKFAGEGKKVIVTTTTHMAWEPERPFADAGDAAGIRQLIIRPDSRRVPVLTGKSLKSCPAFVMLFLWKLTARRGFP